MNSPTDPATEGNDETRILHVCTGEIRGRYFAVIRCKWYGEDGMIGVSEHRLEDMDMQTNLEDFGTFIVNALEANADVTALVACDPEDLGLEVEEG